MSYPTTLTPAESAVRQERARIQALWGEQNHPDGTGPDQNRAEIAAMARLLCQNAAADGTVTWFHILREEFSEAVAETDPEQLRTELVQVAAVTLEWIEALDRRAGAQ